MLLLESSPLPRIMPALDVVKDIRSRLGSCLVLPPIDSFPFEDAEETFRRGVVRTTTHRAHATGHLVGCQKLLVFRRRTLGGFKWSSQHILCWPIGATGQAPLQVFSNQAFSEAWR